MIRVVAKFFLFVVAIHSIVACNSSEIQTVKKRSEEAAVSERKGHVIPKIPEKLTYCGIDIPLDNFDVRERLDRELIINAHFHSSTIQILKKSGRFFPEIERILAQEKVPDDLKYLCVIESALSQATSPTGAKGFWQFMPTTAEEFGLEISNEVDERLDVAKSTRAACDYLKQAQGHFNDWVLTSASYNCGIGGLSRVIEEQQQSNFFDLFLNNETSRYIFRILALKIIMENPEAIGFEISKEELYQPVPVREIKITESITNLASWAKAQGTNLQLLKVVNPWLVGNSLSIKDKSFTLKIPQ